MTNNERAGLLQGCVDRLANMRVPVALTREISVPILTVQDVMGSVIRDMLTEEKPKPGANGTGSAEHEEART